MPCPAKLSYPVDLSGSTLLQVAFLGSCMARGCPAPREEALRAGVPTHSWDPRRQGLRSTCGRREILIFAEWQLSWGKMSFSLGSTTAAEVGTAFKAVLQLLCGIL